MLPAVVCGCCVTQSAAISTAACKCWTCQIMGLHTWPSKKVKGSSSSISIQHFLFLMSKAAAIPWVVLVLTYPRYHRGWDPNLVCCEFLLISTTTPMPMLWRSPSLYGDLQQPPFHVPRSSRSWCWRACYRNNRSNHSNQLRLCMLPCRSCLHLC